MSETETCLFFTLVSNYRTYIINVFKRLKRKNVHITDELTFNNAKTKAKEANWKELVRDGKIFARRTENSLSIIINNAIVI